MKAQCSLLFLGFLFISVESQSNPTPLNHSLKVEKARALSLCLRSIPFEIASETTNSAFTITTNNKEVLSNSTLNIVLKARFDAFQIFLLMAVDTYATSNDKAIGTFVLADNSSTLYDCYRGLKNAAKNSDTFPKRTATVDWNPPSNFSGYVVFKAIFIWNRNDRNVAKSRNIRVRQIISSTASPITTVGTTSSTPTSNTPTVSTSYSQMTTLPEKNSTKPAIISTAIKIDENATLFCEPGHFIDVVQSNWTKNSTLCTKYEVTARVWIHCANQYVLGNTSCIIIPGHVMLGVSQDAAMYAANCSPGAWLLQVDYQCLNFEYLYRNQPMLYKEIAFEKEKMLDCGKYFVQIEAAYWQVLAEENCFQDVTPTVVAECKKQINKTIGSDKYPQKSTEVNPRCLLWAGDWLYSNNPCSNFLSSHVLQVRYKCVSKL